MAGSCFQEMRVKDWRGQCVEDASAATVYVVPGNRQLTSRTINPAPSRAQNPHSL